MSNPPASTARKEGKDEDSVTNDGGPSSFGDDTMFSFSPFTSSGFLDLNRSTDFNTGANSVDVNNVMSEFNREPDVSYPDGNDNVTTDCSTSFMLPWCDPAASYPMKSHGAEARTGRISSNRLPISGNFGIMENYNDNDTTIFPHPYISSRHVAGDFLSLGVGDGAEIKPNSDFSTQAIASKLENQVPRSSQCKSSMVGQIPANTWNLDPFTGIASGVRTDGGGLSRPTLAGSSSLNPIEFPGLEAQQANPQYANFIIDSTQPAAAAASPSGIPVIHQRGRVSQRPIGPQISRPTSLASQFMPRQQQYSRRSYMNASFESSRNNLSDSLEGSSISHAQLGTLTPLTQTRQIVAGRRFPGGVRYRGSVPPLGNLTSQVQSTSTGVTNIYPSPESFQPVGSSRDFGPVAVSGNSFYPRSSGLPFPRSSTIQSATAGPFPRRLGVQPYEPTFRTIGGTPAMCLPAQAYPVRPLLVSGQHHHGMPAQLPHHGMPAQLPTDFPRSDYSSGAHLPNQAYPVRPLLVSGQHHHGMPAQLPTEFSRSDYSSGAHLPAQAYPVRPLASSGQFTPVANYGDRPPGPFVSHPQLKRRATENPSTALASQRRKVSDQPVVIRSPATGQRKSSPAPIPATSHVRTAPYHIKWKGFDEPLEPSGHKCLLCKRDISFTAEGQVYQPVIPPAVAVLACGHTFHEDCLQRITPVDYSIDPPCIPCALGESET
ncbi:hypothetical protein CASFOL_042532 [Castilleja foliolosa]|uniref:RING-type domain-containing protein n=1 Tax=Castilleja foliolosa TaxID=1961234 RepID=A0ABD3B9L2_9LAMI